MPTEDDDPYCHIDNEDEDGALCGVEARTVMYGVALPGYPEDATCPECRRLAGLSQAVVRAKKAAEGLVG